MCYLLLNDGLPPSRREFRAFEREIIRDIPQAKAWGDSTPAARQKDTVTARKVSIVASLIERLRRNGVQDDVIRAIVINYFDRPEVLKALFCSKVNGWSDWTSHTSQIRTALSLTEEQMDCLNALLHMVYSSM